MEGETSWVTHCFDKISKTVDRLESYTELTTNDINKQNTSISVDLILPDDLLERIISFLPIASIFRVGCVCKRWHEIVSSRRFLWNSVISQKPWYFMFTSSDEPIGYAYDPNLRKWYNIDLPFIQTSNWFITSSCGLVCMMDNDTRTQLYICNPITRHSIRLHEPPSSKNSDYTALSISVYGKTSDYNVSITKSKQFPGNFFQSEIWIHIYDSPRMTWSTPLTEMLTGWRGGNESVICNGVLYILIYSTHGSLPGNRHGLISYSLKNREVNRDSLMRSFIRVPCSLTCGRLMNMKEKLVMVGGIGKHDRPDIIKGIGIWVLKGKEWEEMGRMPHRFFQGFGELDDVFASSGSDQLIYIQSYGAPALLVFDMKLKHWKWCQKCPVTKRFPLQLFTGFCFEPRLEIEP